MIHLLVQKKCESPCFFHRTADGTRSSCEKRSSQSATNNILFCSAYITSVTEMRCPVYLQQRSKPVSSSGKKRDQCGVAALSVMVYYSRKAGAWIRASFLYLIWLVPVGVGQRYLRRFRRLCCRKSFRVGVIT